MKKRLLQIVFFMMTIFCGISAFASFDENKARHFLQTTGEELVDALNTDDIWKKCDMLDHIFETKFDTAYIGRFVLGKYVKLFDEDQKKRYDELFRRYIKSLYKTYVLDFETSGVAFEILQITQNEKYVQAMTAITLPKAYQTENIESVRLDFRLVWRDNSYLISDVTIGDLSLIVLLRSRFAEQMQEDEEEPEWFLESLEDLAVSNEANVEQRLQ